MPFPLPKDPAFIKEVVESWILDVEDRVEIGDMEGAELSLRIAQTLYLSLPAGHGNSQIENDIVAARVSLEQHSQKPYANHNRFTGSCSNQCC